MGTTYTYDSIAGRTKSAAFNQASHFGVEINGVSVNGVNKIEGLNEESDIVWFQDGEDLTKRCRPGIATPGPITFTRDFSGDQSWAQWRQTVIDGKTVRQSFSIIMYADDNVTETSRMNFYNGWPSKYQRGDLNSKNSGHQSESITLAWDTKDFGK